MRARIFQPSRNAMQSGQAKTKTWVLEFAPASARRLDHLMGWTGTSDTQTQIRLTFDSLEAAEKYAAARGLDCVVQRPHKRHVNLRPGGYGDNFATNRRAVWTH